MPEPILYRAADARAVLGIGLTRFYELIAAGQLDARKAGSRTLITAESLKCYAESLPRIERRNAKADAANARK